MFVFCSNVLKFNNNHFSAQDVVFHIPQKQNVVSVTHMVAYLQLGHNSSPSYPQVRSESVRIKLVTRMKKTAPKGRLSFPDQSRSPCADCIQMPLIHRRR